MASSRKIIHVDMDCFYAAVEMHDNPQLRHVPMAVGGNEQQRGVLCTSNYIARQFGVRSAMSTVQAKNLCPNLVVVPPQLNKYNEISARIRDIFLEYTDLVEPLSLDEAFLDVTNCKRCKGSATFIAEEIRARIFEQEALTASAGIASNKFLAKIGSDWKKPNGQFVIRPDQVEAFIKQLPVEKIFGVGKVTASKLHKLHVKSCLDLQRFTRNELMALFGAFGERLYHLCRGEDEREVNPSRVRKSLSVEHTYSTDLPDLDICLAQLDQLYKELLMRLEKHPDKKPHKQFVKIKFNNFQQTTVECICQQLSKSIFKRLLTTGFQRQCRAVRLLGLGVSFNPAAEDAVKQLNIALSS